MHCKATILLFLAFAALPTARAQTNSETSGPSKAAPTKPRRVWDNEAVEQIEGGISVVGNPAKPKPQADQSEIRFRQPGKPMMPPNIRPPSIPFTATAMNGMQFNNESLYDNIVLVQLWATWCPHCRNDQAAVDKIARTFASDRVVVLAVDVDEPGEKVSQYLNASPRACPIILSKDTNLIRLFPKRTLPSYLVLRNGMIVGGPARGEQGESGLRALLSSAGVKTD